MSAHCEKHGCNLVYTEYPFMECPMCAAEDRADEGCTRWEVRS